MLLISGTLVRALVVSVVVGVAIVTGLKLAMPMIQLPPMWQMLLALPGFYAYVLVMFAVHAVIPSHVVVRNDRIYVMTGQSHWTVKSEAVRRTRIVVFAADRIRLRVYYLHKERMRSRALGVARKVNLEDLSMTLNVPPEVWDARDRFQTRQKSESGRFGSGKMNKYSV